MYKCTLEISGLIYNENNKLCQIVDKYGFLAISTSLNSGTVSTLNLDYLVIELEFLTSVSLYGLWI